MKTNPPPLPNRAGGFFCLLDHNSDARSFSKRTISWRAYRPAALGVRGLRSIGAHHDDRAVAVPKTHQTTQGPETPWIPGLQNDPERV
jgi:hypothetical protein